MKGEMMHTDDWHGAYRQGWGKNRLRPASFAHPAKVSYGLSVRIYEHALEEGWVKPGDYVVDCFSGIGGFALEALRHGLNFVGVELEQRFCDMGQGCDCTGISKADWVRFQGRWDRARYKDGHHWCPECVMKAGIVEGERKFKPLPLPGTKWAARIALARPGRQATLFDAAPSASYVRNSGKIPCTGPHRYHGNIETWEAQGMPGTAVIVQGDSRRLGEVLAEARLCLSSPPFGSTLGKGGETKGFHSYDKDEAYNRCKRDYVIPEHPANLGNLPDTGLEAALALGSPPYAGSLGDGKSGIDWSKQADRQTTHPHGWAGENYGQQPGQLAQMPEGSFDLALSSPVYHSNTASDDPDKRGGLYRDPKRRNDKTLTATYSKDEAQLAQMPEGDLALTISSPPFLAQSGGTNVTAQSGPLANASLLKRHSAGNQAAGGYGSEEGQLAQMPPGDHAAALEAGAETGRAQCCVSSPPWENQIPSHDNFMPPHISESNPSAPQMLADYGTAYGSTAGQLGQQQGSTFWAASRLILEEVYKVLAPGAHAIWVLKMFVRSGKLVDFPGQWEALCQSVGFKTVCKHRAWMNKNAGIVQTTLDGDEVSMELWYKSFFRILCEKKGAPRIDWELILCMVKE